MICIVCESCIDETKEEQHTVLNPFTSEEYNVCSEECQRSYNMDI